VTIVSIARETWAHKLVVLPVLLLTLVLAAYVAVLRPADYGSSSSVALINPPPAPSPIATDPYPSNPYAGYGDLSVVVNFVLEAMKSEAVVARLRSEGVADGYTVAAGASSVQGANLPPLIDITGAGPTPAAAARASRILDQQVTTTLDQLQESLGVSQHDFITTQVLNPPSQAQTQLAGKFRSLLVVAAFGLIMLFVVLSIRRAAVERSSVANGPASDEDGADARSDTAAGDLWRASTSHSFEHARPRSRAGTRH
jgi:hypothetical protein